MFNKKLKCQETIRIFWDKRIIMETERDTSNQLNLFFSSVGEKMANEVMQKSRNIKSNIDVFKTFLMLYFQHCLQHKK